MTTMATIKNNAQPWIPRLLDLHGLLPKRSCFFFGPRQTGKTSLVRHTLGGVKVYDLLDSAVFLALSRNPSRLAEELGPRQTEKTSLVRHTLGGVKVYDLLDSAVFLALSRNPSRLAEELGPRDSIVGIDEVHSMPILLNEGNRLIQGRGV